MCAQLHDGPTNVFSPYAPQHDANARPPLRTALVEDKVVITEVRSATLRQQGLVPGVEVLTIDGVAARQYGQQPALRAWQRAPRWYSAWCTRPPPKARPPTPTARTLVGVGVQPQVLVRPTGRDLRAGRDTVLEAALQELKTKPKS